MITTFSQAPDGVAFRTLVGFSLFLKIDPEQASWSSCKYVKKDGALYEYGHQDPLPDNVIGPNVTVKIIEDLEH